jgi:alpha-L-rhamnosidase
MDPVRIKEVTFEHHQQAIGIYESCPRLSWKYEGNERNWRQASYEICVTRDLALSESVIVESEQSLMVPWVGQPLRERELATVRLRAQGQTGSWTDWSEPTVVETAFLDNAIVFKTLIEPTLPQEPTKSKRPVLFRRHFTIGEQNIRQARLYITSHGVYEASVNTHPVSCDVLSPGWTSYKHILNYQTYDITKKLQNGKNEIVGQVAEGWYMGRLSTGSGHRNVWGDKLGLAAKIIVTYDTGEELTVETDDKWSCAHGPVISSELYDGETYDARVLQVEAGNQSSSWNPVKVAPFPNPERLRSINSPPVRRIEEIKAKERFISPSRKLIIDFGQNLVGWIRIQVPGPYKSGHTISFVHTEVLEKGECATRPLRDAKATDKLILSDSTNVPFVWEPHFTFHGFRYVEITNWPGEDFQLSYITAVVVHSDMKKLGSFNCSDVLLNQLHANATWSMRGNFLSIPSDCPQRDERLGWTGDIAVFAPTANFLYDTTELLNSWLDSVVEDQLEGEVNNPAYGIPPLVSPNPLLDMPRFPQAIWGDSVIVVPWALYKSTGDIQILKRRWSSMVAWIDRGVKRGPDSLLWDDSLLQMGDWLDPAAPPSEPGNGRTDPNLVANAWLIHSTDLMKEISKLLGRPDDAKRYTTQASQLRVAFNDCYVTPKGRLSSDSQTAYALALHFFLFREDSQITGATSRLCELIKDVSRFKIATGFAGTPILGHALTSQSQTQLFYRMIHHKRNPSWLYPVTMGATTTWERWDSLLEDGSVNPGEMTSFNHYALGSVASWMHEVIGGLRQKAGGSGWKDILVKPEPGGLVTSAEVEFLSPFGKITLQWWISDSTDGLKKFGLKCTIPPNTSASVVLPGMKNDSEAIKIGSGCQEFEVDYSPPSWPPIPKYPPFVPHLDDEP